MLRHWKKLLACDCSVVQMKQNFIYPIMRVGSSSLRHSADRFIHNQEISRCDHINVLIRDPADRFISGLNEYCESNDLSVDDAWHLVERGSLIDRHFAPQYIWLLHLYKFYKGIITIKPFASLNEFTNVHKKKNTKAKTPVPLIKNFVEIDNEIMSYLNQTVELGDIIRRHKNVLS